MPVPHALIRRPVWTIQWAIYNLCAGIAEGYPACCIVRFSLESAILPARPQAVLRFGRWRGRGYVACGWFHEGIDIRGTVAVRAALDRPRRPDRGAR